MTVEFNISHMSTAPLIREMPGVFRTAASIAVNEVAFDAKKRLATQAKRVFDRPTRMTSNPAFVDKKSTKETLNAHIILKDLPKGTGPDVYLAPQIYGGDRNLKRMEKALITKNLMNPNDRFIPVFSKTKMHMDKNGNMKRGKIVQMLSQLSAFGEQGYRANIRDPRRSRYFTVKDKGDVGNLHPGVYYIADKKKPLYLMIGIFVRGPFNYRKRFRYFEAVEKSARVVFPRRFAEIFQERAARKIRKFNLATGASRTIRAPRLP